MLAVPGGSKWLSRGGLERLSGLSQGGFTVPCPRGLAVNAKVHHGVLSLVNTCRGGEDYF